MSLPQSNRKSATSAVTYNDPGMPKTATGDDGTPDPVGNPNGRRGGPLFPVGTDENGNPIPGPGGVISTVPGSGNGEPTGTTPTGVVGPPTIDAAAQARDRQDALLRRRGRRNYLTTGPRGAGIPDVVVNSLTGLDGNPLKRRPGSIFPNGRGGGAGTNDNPNSGGGGNPNGRRGGGMFPGGLRKSYNAFS
jgi:hypothetical protein